MIAPRILVAALALAAVVAGTSARAAQVAGCPDKIDLRDLMTVSAYDKAGLEKLTKEQLSELNAWLTHYVHGLCATPTAPAGHGAAPRGAPPPAAPATGPAPPAKAGGAGNPAHTSASTPPAAVSGAAAFGAPPVKTRAPNQIESRIIGEFHGWTGDTVFKLSNGQVWKQAGPGFFETDLHNPKVIIKKLLIGYVLQVNGYAKEVFVRRIQ